MQPRIGSDQSLNIFYQALTLEYRSTEPCSCYNKAIDEICRRSYIEKEEFCRQLLSLHSYMEISPETKEDDLFRSNFARFKLPLMDIEVMGDLQIKKNDIWQSVCVKEYEEIFIGNLIIKIPTIEEQKRILSLFGREKDLKRILILNHYLL